ncbi:hypothetical protein AAFF_G00137950 [Aldrovandia affinis]|uniref:Ig-like domain-containing protein n=1 Tax=Aldrovandia affinis TaxID=143900 RepID=A0AAD7TDC5_9TELE|nr:hypothetical protein AAFF_G00137950 [Aldrovandia affinis]
MSDSYRRETPALVLRLGFQLLVIIGAGAETPHFHATMTVLVPHLSYTCPAGANVTMQCVVVGTPMHAKDKVQLGWLFTPHQNQRCHEPIHPRMAANHSHPQGVHYNTTKDAFLVTLLNVSHSDQGRYCCLAREIHMEKHHLNVVQNPHGYVLLTVTPRQNGSLKCTAIDHKPPEGTVAAGLAIAGCIMGILSLPLILLLVYKQRQTAQSNRRAHELVRMDSEPHGHENPVFLGGSPQNKTRTVSQIMTRQSSETGRHLLSEPSTPLSPPAHGDVFFPSQEPIPESPDFMQV